MDAYTACAIAEGFDNQEHTEAEIIEAWQFLIDTGMAWTLQGWFGRNAAAMIEAGVCHAKEATPDSLDDLDRRPYQQGLDELEYEREDN